MDGTSSPLLSAVMIVKDEQARLPRTLPPLLHACDEVLVADTGSSDATAAVAARLGARVVHVPWTGDFAAARNAAAAHARGRVVLVVDADDELDGSRDDLRAAAEQLAGWHAAHPGRALAGAVDVHCTSETASWTIRSQRLYLTSAAEYAGRVHEQLRPTRASRLETLDVATVSLVHSGYESAADEAAKARRNTELLTLALDEVEDASPDRPWLLVDLGRSLLACGRLEDGLTLLADAAAGDDPAASAAARDFAARALLGAGLLTEALAVIDGLAADGAQPDYAAYLYGQVAVLVGDPDSAVELLGRADAAARAGRLMDCSGRVLGPATVAPMLALAHELDRALA